VVAEGVETPEHVNALKAMNCPYGQGFHFSKALEASSTEALLSKGWLW
jgi:EAL domain-containing protein (putative c-di-GMP-specific phosphodiesterase class I)